MDIERALKQRAQQRSGDEGDRQPGEERHAGPVHQHQRDITARHGEGAMRQVDEIHQPERDGEPACQHEQQHAIGDPVEQNGQHGGRRSPDPATVLAYIAVASRRPTVCL